MRASGKMRFAFYRMPCLDPATMSSSMWAVPLKKESGEWTPQWQKLTREPIDSIPGRSVIEEQIKKNIVDYDAVELGKMRERKSVAKRESRLNESPEVRAERQRRDGEAQAAARLNESREAQAERQRRDREARARKAAASQAEAAAKEVAAVRTQRAAFQREAAEAADEGDGEGEPGADGKLKVGDFERCPHAALHLQNELNGHEITWDAEHPPDESASEEEHEAWVERMIKVIDDHVHVSLEEQAKIYEKAQAKLSVEAVLPACASCGRKMCDEGYLELDVRALPSVFRLTDEQRQQREELGTLDVLELSDGDPHLRLEHIGERVAPVTRTVDLCEMVSCYELDDDLYHLHPDLVHTGSVAGEPRVWLCNCQCAKVAAAGGECAPSRSLAAGVDFGRLDVLGLPEPSAIEQLILSDVRLYALVQKVTMDGKNLSRDWLRETIKGHSIYFLQSGASAVTEALTTTIEERIEDMHKCLKVYFLGPKGSRDALIGRLLQTDDMAIRPTVVYNFLRLRNRVRIAARLEHPNAQCEPPTFEAVLQALRPVPAALAHNAVEGTTLDVEQRTNRASDVAAVRSVATECTTEADALLQMALESEGNESLLEGVAVSLADEGARKESECVLEAVTPDPRNIQRPAEQETELVMDEDGRCSAVETGGTGGGTHNAVDEAADTAQGRAPIMNRVGLMNAGAGPEAIVDGSIQAITSVIKVSREDRPLTEFARNGVQLMEAFWYLFPLGRGLEAFEGTINKTATKHLMMHYTNRFQRSAALTLVCGREVKLTAAGQTLPLSLSTIAGVCVQVLGNQAQRHTVLRSVSGAVKQERWAEAVALANNPDFLQLLEEARENPRSKKARSLLRTILPMLSLCGRPCPWGALERASCIGQLCAMMRRFGTLSLFLTFAPDDVHNPLGIRLSVAHRSNSAFPAIKDDFLHRMCAQPELFKAMLGANEGGEDASWLEGDIKEQARHLEDWLQQQAARNPASSSLMFKRLVDVVMNDVVGFIPSLLKSKPIGERDKGLFGTPVAMFGVVEETGRGAHHLHVVAWCGAMPDLCSGAALDERVFGRLRKALDAQYKCELDEEVHILDVARRATFCKFRRCEWSSPPTFLIADGSDRSPEFSRSAQITAAGKQLHAWDGTEATHDATCKKSPQGDCACRMCMPAGHPVPQTRAVNVQGVALPDAKGSEAPPLHMPVCSGEPLPWEQLSCGLSDDETAFGLPACWCCCPGPATGKSVLNTGALLLSVTSSPHRPNLPRAVGGEGTTEAMDMDGVAGSTGGAAVGGEGTTEAMDVDGVAGSTVGAAVGGEGTTEATEAKASGIGVLVPRERCNTTVLELRRKQLAWPPEHLVVKKLPKVADVQEVHTMWQKMHAELPEAVLKELETEEWAEVRAVFNRLSGAEVVKHFTNVDVLHMRKMVAVWSKAKCANARVTVYNEMLTVLLRCNVAPLMMGSRESSRAAAFYLVKYLTKDTVALNATLSLLVDAKRNVERFASTADDAESNPHRKSTHFFQRAVNSYVAEVCDTQAAALLLGHEASVTSERFVYLASWDAVDAAFDVRNEEPPWLRSVSGGTELAGEEAEEEADTVQIGCETEWARERKEEAFDGMGCPGARKTWKDRYGETVAVRTADHYQYRGEKLRAFNQMEYAACVDVKVKTEKELAEFERLEAGFAPDAETRRPGRRPNGKVCEARWHAAHPSRRHAPTFRRIATSCPAV